MGVQTLPPDLGFCTPLPRERKAGSLEGERDCTRQRGHYVGLKGKKSTSNEAMPKGYGRQFDDHFGHVMASNASN